VTSRQSRAFFLTIFIFCVIVSNISLAQIRLEQLVQKYWLASSTIERQKAAKEIVRASPVFSELYQLLSVGKRYPVQSTGIVKVPQGGKYLPPHAVVIIPADYQPDLSYPVQVYLHGAVTNNDPFFLYRYTLDTLDASLLQTKSILIFPSGWSLAPWWCHAQADNIHRLLSWVKENYNINENQVRLRGVSDGGIGCYYLANADQTPWSVITPFIGSLRALNQLSDRQIYLSNFINSSMFIVNTNQDEIFDITWEQPYINKLLSINSKTSFVQVDSSRHSLLWYPALKDSIERFNQLHDRNPFPDALIWQTEDVVKYGRYKYIRIDKLGSLSKNNNANDENQVQMLGTFVQAFSRETPSGLLKVTKSNNVVTVETQGVLQYTILVSPDHFDLTSPVKIITNGKKSFEGIVHPDVETLLKWNLKDNDRKMLFAAEIKVKVN